MSPNNLSVIYYGWLTSDASGIPNHLATAIAAARPQALIAVFYTAQPKFMNLSPQVRDLLHSAGTRIYAYTSLGYGARDHREVQADVAHYLANGADGIFFDEADSSIDGVKTRYYKQLYEQVKQHGQAVILNTGVAATSEALMSVADILMVEHQWRAFAQTCPWRAKYAPERFMGNSSNEPGALQHLYYPISRATGVRDTRAAWASGIGWHYSTDRYTDLPPWFADYTRAIREH